MAARWSQQDPGYQSSAPPQWESPEKPRQQVFSSILPFSEETALLCVESLSQPRGLELTLLLSFGWLS